MLSRLWAVTIAALSGPCPGLLELDKKYHSLAPERSKGHLIDQRVLQGTRNGPHVS